MSKSALESFLYRKSSGCQWNPKKTHAKCSIFTTPSDIIFDTLLVNAKTSNEDVAVDNTPPQPIVYQISTGLTCQACSLTFESIQQQRDHFKTDLHQINLKRKLHNLPPLSLSDMESSVSNISDETESMKELMSSSEEEKDNVDIYLDSDNEDNVDENIDRNQNLPLKHESEAIVTHAEYGTCISSYSSKNGHLLTYRKKNEFGYDIIFNTSILPQQNMMYNIDANEKLNHKYWQQLYQLSQLNNRSTANNNNNQLWAVFILSSGRFAGTIFNCQNNQIIISKVFRRYTVRAKAGGSQSSHDNSVGKARSMGAILRRYGEMELIKDIQELLSMWSNYIQTCSKILISVPKTMRHILYDFTSVQHVVDASLPSSSISSSSSSANNTTATTMMKNLHISESPLQKDDARISYIPFMVGKPTLDETKAIFEKCTTVIFKRIELSSIEEGKEETVIRNSNNAIDEDDFVNELYFQDDLLYASNLINATNESSSSSSLLMKKKPLTTTSESTTEGLPKCKLSKLLIQACRTKNISHVRNILISLNTKQQQQQKQPSGNESIINNDDGHDSESDVQKQRHPELALIDDINGPLLIDYIDNDDDDEDDGDDDEGNKDDENMYTMITTTSTSDNIAYQEMNKNDDDDGDDDTIQWDLESVINLPEDIHNLFTPLHTASELGYNSIIRLLLQYGADPCKVDYRNRTPYFLAKEKSTRDVFRKIRGVNELKWNWEKSGVGEGLTLEKENNKKEKEKEKKKRLKLKKKQEKEKSDNEIQEKLKILEFEKIQKEAAILMFKNTPCDGCGQPLNGVKPMEFSGKKCCSTNCVVVVRRRLAAEAAMSRIGSKRLVM